MKITPARRINGRAQLPGDKSISHRAAIIAALANGASRITNFSPSEDCAATLSCLRELGVSIQSEGSSSLIVQGAGEFGLRVANEALYCGNSGSTMRMLAGVLAGQDFSSTLTGDNSLNSRPMQRIIEPLQLMGAELGSKNGKPPLTVKGLRPLKPIRYELPVASAQVKSCVLLAGLNAQGRTEVIERGGETRDHTERLLQWFGVPLERSVEGSVAISIDGPRSFAARDVSVPGDISSAAFLIAAAALLPGSKLEVEDVGLNPTRTMFVSMLRSLGAVVEVTDRCDEGHEPIGRLRVKGKLSAEPPSPVDSTLVRGNLIPQLIDELPLLAVVGTQVPGGIEIRDAAELRRKESDRIDVTVKNLRAMGAEVQEFEDGLAVHGRTQLRGAMLDSYGDHRIAMAFAVAALTAAGDSEIAGAQCVSVSFPDFFRCLESLVER
ncbi:MAG: 3-phosphoshikimate 1-carboxyvinyltransferase [Pyrinomonadaceae bacterium]|jgi:3-phosphoshikimate 1-carboxyvinyltransferase|nr:3-phosphoshikimate 1-carboxyvinyltransferase [Pyrinomonadaceae bacterium]